MKKLIKSLIIVLAFGSINAYATLKTQCIYIKTNSYLLSEVSVYIRNGNGGINPSIKNEKTLYYIGDIINARFMRNGTLVRKKYRICEYGKKPKLEGIKNRNVG